MLAEKTGLNIEPLTLKKVARILILQKKSGTKLAVALHNIYEILTRHFGWERNGFVLSGCPAFRRWREL